MTIKGNFFRCSPNIDVNFDRSLKCESTTKLKIIKADSVVDWL